MPKQRQLIERDKRGQRTRIRLHPDAMIAARNWLDENRQA